MTSRIRPGITWFLLGVAIVLGQGCGSTQRTLAQDLAWERWSQCSLRHAGVSLSRIDPDGRVWVTYGGDDRLGFNAWNECMLQAAVEQGRTSTPILPAAVATAPPVPAGAALPAPRWNIGDEWAFRYERPSGAGTFVWTVARIEPLEGDPHYVIRSGTSREIFYRVADFAFTREMVEGKVIRVSRPSRWRWVDFPLTVGKSWEMKWTDERPPDRQTEEIERRCVAESPERVTVPAGTFETIRVACYNVRDGAKTLTFWYAPAVRQFVRGEFPSASGLELREMIGHKLR